MNGITKIIHNIVMSGTIAIPNVFGEATASYAVMDDDLINEIFLLNPNIKIMLFIRNPVERAWSNAKRVLVRDKGVGYEQVPFSEFEKFYQDENQIRGGSYSKIITRWQQYVQPDNLFVGFFDDIKNAPEDLLLRVFEFLEVSTDDKYLRKDAKKVINPTMQKAIPEEHFRLLMDIYGPELKEINKRYGRSWY